MAKVLVVDDRADNRQFLMVLLGNAGHNVVEAGDGAEALVLTRAERPDLIISDILMPTVDGYEFVRRVRSDQAIAKTPVIFFTAVYHEREALALAAACGVRYVMKKPCSVDLILRVVSESLRLSPPATSGRKETFDHEHLRLVNDKLAAKVAELEAVTGKLTRLVEVSQQLALEPDPKRLLERYCEAAREIIGAKYAAIGVFAQEGRSFQPFLLCGANVSQMTSPPADLQLFRAVRSEQRAVRERNLSESAGVAGLPPTHPRQGSFLGVPITSAGELYGILYVIGKLGGKPFGEEDERLALSLAAQLGSAYRNVLQFEQLKQTNVRLEREITQRKQAEEELQDSAALLHVLSRRLMDAQETERRSIARELHDEVGQELSTLRLNLHLLKAASSPEERTVCINDSVGLVERTLQQVRDLSLNLRPSVLDDLGLVPALEWQLSRLAARAGFSAQIRTEGWLGRLPTELETTCFRVVQEALTNVVRHARARQVILEVLQSDRELILTVRDDGVGFDVNTAAARGRGGESMGLLGMQERVSFAGGELTLHSSPGCGAEVRIRFPLTDVRAGCIAVS